MSSFAFFGSLRFWADSDGLCGLTDPVVRQPTDSANPIYLPEGGKPPHLLMFEIRAAYVGCTISFFLLSLLSRSHQPPLSRAAARVS